MRPANGTPPADGGGIANARCGRRRRAAASRTHMSTRSSTRRSASPASLPRARKASYSAAACVLSSSSTSSSTGSHAWPFASNARCSRGFQSGMANPSDAIQRQEERVPRRTLCRERFSARARQAIVAPTPLSRTLDPAPVDQALVFEAIERRIQRGSVKGDGAVRPFVDQLADFVAVALAFVEQRQNEDFGAPPLQLALEQSCRHMWRDYILDLFRTEGAHWRNRRGAAGGDERGDKRAGAERDGSDRERERIPERHTVELSRDQATGADGQRQGPGQNGPHAPESAAHGQGHPPCAN